MFKRRYIFKWWIFYSHMSYVILVVGRVISMTISRWWHNFCPKHHCLASDIRLLIELLEGQKHQPSEDLRRFWQRFEKGRPRQQGRDFFVLHSPKFFCVKPHSFGRLYSWIFQNNKITPNYRFTPPRIAKNRFILDQYWTRNNFFLGPFSRKKVSHILWWQYRSFACRFSKPTKKTVFVDFNRGTRVGQWVSWNNSASWKENALWSSQRMQPERGHPFQPTRSASEGRTWRLKVRSHQPNLTVYLCQQKVYLWMSKKQLARWIDSDSRKTSAKWWSSSEKQRINILKHWAKGQQEPPSTGVSNVGQGESCGSRTYVVCDTCNLDSLSDMLDNKQYLMRRKQHHSIGRILNCC